MELTLEEINTGVKKEFNYNRTSVCTGCKGRGAKRIQRCPGCGGRGVEVTERRMGRQVFQMQRPCSQWCGLINSRPFSDRFPTVFRLIFEMVDFDAQLRAGGVCRSGRCVKIMNCVSKTRNFVSKTRNFVFKMMKSAAMQRVWSVSNGGILISLKNPDFLIKNPDFLLKNVDLS